MRERVASMVATLEWSSGIRSERQDFEKHTLGVAHARTKKSLDNSSGKHASMLVIGLRSWRRGRGGEKMHFQSDTRL